MSTGWKAQPIALSESAIGTARGRLISSRQSATNSRLTTASSKWSTTGFCPLHRTKGNPLHEEIFSLRSLNSVAYRCWNDANNARIFLASNLIWKSISRKIGIAVRGNPDHSVFPTCESRCPRIKPVSVVATVSFILISVIRSLHDRRSVGRSRSHCDGCHIMAVLRIVAVARAGDVGVASGLRGVCAGEQKHRRPSKAKASNGPGQMVPQLPWVLRRLQVGVIEVCF